MVQSAKFGIYLNPEENKVVRINSPYWFPESPPWVSLTTEVNATLSAIRDIIRERKLVPDPEAVVWGTIPSHDQS